MALALPKLVYTPIGGVAPSTFNFARAPRFVAAYNRRATRHDNLSTAGVKEVVVERVDNFLEITMEWVAIGSDVNGWDAFMQNALQGVQFSYYADATQRLTRTTRSRKPTGGRRTRAWGSTRSRCCFGRR